jgi:hypothetical protein
MMKRIAEASPSFKERMAGVFYLLTMPAAAFTERVASPSRIPRQMSGFPTPEQ